MHLTENLKGIVFGISVASKTLENIFFLLIRSKQREFGRGVRNIIGFRRTHLSVVASAET